MELIISDWSVWSLGMTCKSDGRIHTKNSDDKPDVSFVPAMFRRRLSPLARMVFSTVNCLSNRESLSQMPIVFASRHGELNLSLGLTNKSVTKEALSPTAFSMSVHNSVAGLLSIYYKCTEAVSAIAAGEKSLYYGLFEASAQLSHHEHVLMIYADDKMPKIYQDYQENKLNEHARCLVMVLNKKGQKISFKEEENNQQQFSSLFSTLTAQE